MFGDEWRPRQKINWFTTENLQSMSNRRLLSLRGSLCVNLNDAEDAMKELEPKVYGDYPDFQDLQDYDYFLGYSERLRDLVARAYKEIDRRGIKVK